MKLHFNRLLLAGFLLGLVATAGCGTLSSRSNSERIIPPEKALNESYHLRIGDDLEVSVWGHDDLGRKGPIREDGTFSFVMIGNIQAAGRTLRELEQEVGKRLNQTYTPTPEAQAPALPVSRQVIPAEKVANPIYFLQAGDELEIVVWGQDDLNREAQVREDGIFSFPLIGNVQAAGRALKDVEQEVQERLDRDYIVNPHVTVRLSKAKFTVLGAVSAPGSYPIEGVTDLLAAISQAGGSKLGTGIVDIIRVQKEGTITLQANLDNILQGKRTNVTILPRDTLYVTGGPSGSLELSIRLAGAKFSVLGEVERPGSYPIEGTMDLLTAISQAGGITKFGSSHIEIIRQQEGKKIAIRSNLARILQGKETNVSIVPHDTIYVRRRLL